MNKRLTEIEQRLFEIGEDIELRGDTLTADTLTGYEQEVNNLIAERTQIAADCEKRAALLNNIASGNKGGTVLRAFPKPGTMPEENIDPRSSEQYRHAFMNYVLRGAAIPDEYRTDATTYTTDAGAAIPTTVLNTIVDKLDSTGIILPLVNHTAYKGGVSIPTSTVKPIAMWANEGAGSDKQKKTTGSVTFSYHKLRCAVAVSLEVDNMTLSAFEAAIMNNVVEAMTKATEQAIISGTGTGQPRGILIETPATGQTVSSVAPSLADLKAAEGALPMAYENGAVWCMSKKTFMEYACLVDEVGQPIGRINYGINGKVERVLLGRPVICCDYVTSYSEGLDEDTAFAFIFNFKDYTLNTNYAMTVKKYEDNDTDDIVTKAVMLVDGKVIDINSLVTVTKAAAPVPDAG